MKKNFKKKFFFNGQKTSFGVQKIVFENFFQKISKKISLIFFQMHTVSA